MKYRVELAAAAKADIREAARWVRDRASPATADKWLAGLLKTINSLETRPLRCPVAAESHKFPTEIHELLHGKRKQDRYRIIFQVIERPVYVLYFKNDPRFRFLDQVPGAIDRIEAALQQYGATLK
jgi:plasmid stabilization system protein ParE